MRLRPSLLVVAFLMLGPAVSQAFAVTVRDLVALSREGVSDPVLVALIETDGSKFTLNADDIRSLRYQGLSDTVIVAMIRTAKAKVVTEVEDPAPADQAVERIVSSPPAPVVVNQHVTQQVRVEREVERPVYVPVYVAVPTKPADGSKAVKKEEPVYWGWGGQRRPDAWKEPVVIKK